MAISTRKAALSGLAGIGVVALLAACGQAPESSGDSSTGEAIDYLPCIVSDSGGFDDKSFNQSSYEGLVEAADALGIDEKHAQSDSEDDFAPNITSMVDAGCDLIITVGYLLADATKEAAEANPDVDFVILDDNSITADNVKPVVYDTSQAAFLAGYASADISETGKVGTFGGMQIPTVTIFMDGFADGVAYYNEQKGTDVSVVGWNVDSQQGTFTGGFDANDTAKQAATTIIDQGVDVLLPVGGPIYQSAIEAVKDSGEDIAMIGVDADLYETADGDNDMFYTSILKQMKQGVEDIVTDAAGGDFDATPYVGTLENDGVGIAELRGWTPSDTLADELETIKAGIIDGSIDAESDASPSAE